MCDLLFLVGARFGVGVCGFWASSRSALLSPFHPIAKTMLFNVFASSTTNEDMTTTTRLHQVPVTSQPNFSPSIFPTPLVTCNNDAKESMMSQVGANNIDAHLSLTLSYSYDYLNLARPHSSVNWHLHCSHKVYQSFCIGYPPMGLCTYGKPLPWPIKTPTLGGRYRFAGVRVQVALENPRVSHDNH